MSILLASLPESAHRLQQQPLIRCSLAVGVQIINFAHITTTSNAFFSTRRWMMTQVATTGTRRTSQEHQGRRRLLLSWYHPSNGRRRTGSFASSSSSTTLHHSYPSSRPHGPRRTSASPSTWPYYVLASIPTLIWCRDSFVDVVRVEGKSMEPTLQPGDWILVRKADAGMLPQALSGLVLSFGGGGGDGGDETTDHVDGGPPAISDKGADGKTMDTLMPSSNNKEKNQQQQKQQHSQRSFLSWTEVSLLRSKIRHYLMFEQQQQLLLGSGGGHAAAAAAAHPWWYVRPPMVLPGQVVVLKSPQHFNEWHVKRVIAMGGQWLQHSAAAPPPPSSSRRSSKSSSSSSSDAPILWSTTSTRLQLIPQYTIHVEGDGCQSWDDDDEEDDEDENSSSTTSQSSCTSIDSRTYGPVSKNCLVGVAECIVWPPRRWQWLRIARTPMLFGRPRAFWRTS
ncbi:hypothetical protein ACA910_012323 [Epithemia clementina (nom. ined.)]